MQRPFSTHPELFVTSADLEHPSLSGLDGAEAVLDWQKLEQIMAGIYASKTGRPSYPLLTLLHAALLGIWYRLSDVELAQTLFRDLLFRKFCHLELGGDVPDATTIGRFRQELVAHDLWELLLGDVVALYADAAYSSLETRDRLATFGIDDQVQRKGYRGNPLSDVDRVRNDEIAVIRSGGERPFATYKSRYGLARSRFIELAKT